MAALNNLVAQKIEMLGLPEEMRFVRSQPIDGDLHLAAGARRFRGV